MEEALAPRKHFTVTVTATVEPSSGYGLDVTAKGSATEVVNIPEGDHSLTMKAIESLATQSREAVMRQLAFEEKVHNDREAARTREITAEASEV